VSDFEPHAGRCGLEKAPIRRFPVLKIFKNNGLDFFGGRPAVQRLEFEGFLESMALLASGPREYPWVTEYPDLDSGSELAIART